MNKFLAVLLCACLVLGCAWAEEAETIIILGENITVNGGMITENESASVYLAHRAEKHEDVPEELEGLVNRVVTISRGGTYRISGTAEDTQLAVCASDADMVRIILDGADITCRTAPAIAVYTARDSRVPGEYGVTFELASGSESRITGSHTEKIKDDDVKLSGAITSLVSIGFEGDGYLNMLGDNEGIETKFGHMTFNGGNIIVTSGDDPLNASEDEVSVITVNDGTLHLQVNPVKGGEGDGIDSNGFVVINGGVVVSYAHPDSMDSGIDSDLGCTINGGIVLGAGNMYDEISAQSGQLFMVLQFAQKTGEMIVLTRLDGTLVAVSDPNEGYTNFVFSSPEITEGDYYLYLGGELEMQDGEMVYTPGQQLQHSESAFGKFGRGFMPGMPEDMDFPKDMPERPENMQMPERPEGMKHPGGMQPPEGDRFRQDAGNKRPFGEGESSEEASVIFHLASGNSMFGNITPVE